MVGSVDWKVTPSETFFVCIFYLGYYALGVLTALHVVRRQQRLSHRPVASLPCLNPDDPHVSNLNCLLYLYMVLKTGGSLDPKRKRKSQLS